MKITEIFLSIQGESSYSGLPCIFIRLTGCNLRCSYCDTTYSYNGGIDLALDEIIEKIKPFNPIKLVEITGGEPLLQQDTIALIEKLKNENYTILLETNGSISCRKVPEYVHKIIDIKCPDSGEGDSFLWENLTYLNQDDEIKFVISSRDDYNWVKEIILQHNLKKHNLLISTVFDKLLPEKAVSWIVEDKLPVRFQLQMHKYIWDPEKKGV